MANFIITKEQLNIVGTIVAELPAKISLPAIDVLRNLQPAGVSAPEGKVSDSE